MQACHNYCHASCLCHHKVLYSFYVAACTKQNNNNNKTTCITPVCFLDRDGPLMWPLIWVTMFWASWDSQAAGIFSLQSFSRVILIKNKTTHHINSSSMLKKERRAASTKEQTASLLTLFLYIFLECTLVLFNIWSQTVCFLFDGGNRSTQRSVCMTIWCKTVPDAESCKQKDGGDRRWTAWS